MTGETIKWFLGLLLTSAIFEKILDRIFTRFDKKKDKSLHSLHIAIFKARNTALFSIMDHYGRKYAILVAWYFHAP